MPDRQFQGEKLIFAKDPGSEDPGAHFILKIPTRDLELIRWSEQR